MSNVRAAPPAPSGAAGGYEERVLRALRRIVRAIDLQSRRLEQEVGLTGPQLICLRVLDQRGPIVGLSLREARGERRVVEHQAVNDDPVAEHLDAGGRRRGIGRGRERYERSGFHGPNGDGST